MTMTLEVDGERVTGFAGGSVTQSLDAIASTFTLQYGDDALNQSGRFVVEVGDAVKTLVDGDVLLDGYVMDDDRSYSSQSESASVSGVSRTGDVVESNAYVAGKTKWRNASLKEIVDALLDGYDVQARIDADASPNFRRFAFHEGETIANAIKTAAAKRGALIVDDAGVLAFERAGQRST
ncbi:MAG: phage baseplate assembly protein, partial [Myxococcota bacterium]